MTVDELASKILWNTMEVDRYQHLTMRSSFRFSFLGVYALDGEDVQLSVFHMSRVEDHLLCGRL